MSSVTIFDIKRFAVHDGPGIRTTVFLKGCPMDCWWCHNPESRKSEPEEIGYKRMLGDKVLQSRKTYGKLMSISELMCEILKDKIFFEESGGGVTFSGGEPLYQTTALCDLLVLCKKQGLHTVVDTSGYAPWSSFEKIIANTDLFLYDLKLIDPGNHERITGVENRLIIQNLQKLVDRDVNVELRIPVIPGINDSQHEIERYKALLQKMLTKSSKIHLLPYHNIAENKYKKLNVENRMSEIEGTCGEDIKDIKKDLESVGFTVSIGG